MAPLLEGLAQAAAGASRRSHLELAIDDPAITVKASADRLLQVLENLLDNAASFSPPASRHRPPARKAGREAMIEVEDRGPGIPPEHLDRIFERFFSYRPGQSDAASHTGLGLAIVKAIVEGYGGRIAASNAPAGGALFEVRLPLDR